MSLEPAFHDHSLGLLTDLYQLTMAHGYWKLGKARDEAVFHLFFRKPPFGGGYTVAAGLEDVLGYLEHLRFDAGDLAYLGGLEGNDGKPLFAPEFLDHLRELAFTLDVDAVPEGTVVFPQQPLVRVQGSVLQCQLVETALLNLVNFPTLIATKAARICAAAHGAPVLEFGLRRAQGIDGALTASRAAYIGGCAATSNVQAGKRFGIPVAGTHAHSWVMAFDDEDQAFAAYAEAMPNNCVFLVDTYDTIEGVRRAVAAGKRLRERGHEMIGIRLDSGDLAYLSQEARRILDEEGFPDARVLASNDLDEFIITSLRDQGAKIGSWGVGTRLVTGHGDPALGGVYKLAALRKPCGEWEPRIKLSEQAIKITTPGILQVRRFRDARGFVADMVYDTLDGAHGERVIVDPADPTRMRRVPGDAESEELLVPMMRGGRLVYERPGLDAIRARVQAQLASLSPGVRRLLNPHQYPAGIARRLHERKMQLVVAARGLDNGKAAI